MGRGRGVAIAAGLVVLLVAGVATAWLVGGRSVAGSAPLRAPAEVPIENVGDPSVVLSADARTHPAAEIVRAQLQVHFDAINGRDYAAWATTVVPERSEALPELRWLEAYDTTQDGSIRIDRIDDIQGSRVLVRLRFISTQDISDAPRETPARRLCWRSSLPMSDVPPVLEVTGPGSSVAEAC